MPDADPRLDPGRWAAASFRARGGDPETAAPRPRRGFWRRLGGCCGCCGCCRRGNEDWEPPPGEVPGRRPPQPLRPGLLAPRGLVVASPADRVAHHTADFQAPRPVLRRGQPFGLRVLLPRPFDPDDDALCVELTLGPNPQVAKGTHVLIPLGETSATGWTAEVEEGEGAEPPAGPALSLRVAAPPDAPIGRYCLSVKTRTGAGDYAPPFDDANDFFLLFNPWCPDDHVYMEKTSDLNEYVLNETGRIFYGTEDQIAERSWNYGQFDAGVLEACLYILDRRGMPHSARGDPVMVSRVVSAMVNSLDDNGVLVGNWTGDYGQGTNPSAWAGSVAILRAFHRTGPVRYGQCWVFAGVMTTVLRCLGLPTRTVTNYNSAHDTDVSLTTDIYFDENMRPLERLNTDSVWNFHVWNDCWMKRPDLPEGYDGWQVVDATPQETSSGLFCCGPCSVTAVKNGEVFLKYDTPFVFAEVNSDKVYWQRQAGGAFAVVHVEEGAIGRRISTLGAGSGARLDITHQYKHPEGSEEERRAVSTATSHGSRPRAGGGSPSAGEVTVRVGAGPAVAGAELELRATVGNGGAEPRTLRLRLALGAVRYTGVAGAPFRQEQHRRVLPPGQEETVTMTVAYEEYGPHVGEQDALKLTAAGVVEETGQVVAKELRVRLHTPELTLTLLAPAVVGQEVPVQVVFQNPLPEALSGATLRMEGAGLSCPKPFSLGSVGAGQTVRLRQAVVPLRAGRRRLVAALESPRLGPLHGSLQFDAAPAEAAPGARSGGSPPRRPRRARRRAAPPAGSTGG
ncbi:protein-glutamine gamma-glutamyltransferase K [Larus michahellis]|uniref:protein-glutamine gamma-glutamyltransferase K n=1 Tax=Larus michahellis TaxID=119627 RepID=UPI003D9B4BDF